MLFRFDDIDFKQDWVELLKNDPIHPDIPISERIIDGRTVFALASGDMPEAMICAKLTDHISRSMEDILSPSQQKLVAMFYTVFRLPGAAGGVGADIINNVISYCKEQGIEQLYTLSPVPTLRKHFAEMPTEEQVREFIEAKKDPVARFHLGNGARLASVNFDADSSPKRMAESWGIMVNYNYS